MSNITLFWLSDIPIEQRLDFINILLDKNILEFNLIRVSLDDDNYYKVVTFDNKFVYYSINDLVLKVDKLKILAIMHIELISI